MTDNKGASKVSVVDIEKDVCNNKNADGITDHSYFSKLLYPVELSSAIFGMLIFKKRDNRIQGNSSGKASWFDLFKSTLIYNLLICILLVANCIRHFAAFWLVGSGEDFVFRIIGSFWIVIGTVNAIMLVKSSHPTYGNYQTALQILDTKILIQFGEIGIVYPTKKLKKLVKIVLIAIWTHIFLLIVTLTIFNFVSISSALTEIKEVFIEPFESGTAAVILAFGVEILICIAYGIPVSFCIIMCLVLKYSFKELTTHFSAFITDHKSESHEEYAKYRLLHLQLCKCVDILDKDLSCFFANWYIINIPQSCFISYILLNKELDPISIVLLLFWLLAGLALVLVTSGFAASVHQEAHSLLDQIYDITAKDLTDKQMREIQLLLFKLTGTQIGLTVYNIVIITKEFILTVGGVYLTYLFLVLQFKI